MRAALEKENRGEDIMSAADIDTGFDLAATRGGPDEISRRLEGLPASSYLCRLVILLSLGGWFEVYDLFFTAYILHRAGPQPQRTTDHHDAGLFWLFGGSRLRRCDLCRAVRRHLPSGIFGRPVRTAVDLHLCPAGLHRGFGGDGVPDHVRWRAAVAVHRP